MKWRQDMGNPQQAKKENNKTDADVFNIIILILYTQSIVLFEAPLAHVHAADYRSGTMQNYR
jgi:hypothetical protein